MAALEYIIKRASVVALVYGETQTGEEVDVIA